MKSRPILYIKSGCPWCDDALAYFARQKVELEVKDVRRDSEAMRRMQEISDQTLTPTFEYGDFMVPDFSVEEFQAAVKKRPDVQDELGLRG